MSSRCKAFAFGPLLLAALLLPGCNALNPLCGSSRPSPVMTSIAPNSVTFAQVQQTAQITVTGSHFVAASMVVVNGKQVATTVPSSTQLVGTVSTASIPGPGSYNVYVTTPSGNSGDLGCSSGGNSSNVSLTVD
jgi:hypothetical protein